LGTRGKTTSRSWRAPLERQRVSAVAGGKLELPGQGVPKLELGNEGNEDILSVLAKKHFERGGD
jgi:hypothetical protein